MGRGENLESGFCGGGSGGFPDHVLRLTLLEIVLDADLLIPVGIQLQSPLLHQHAGISFAGFKGETGKIAFHGGSLPKSENGEVCEI